MDDTWGCLTSLLVQARRYFRLVLGLLIMGLAVGACQNMRALQEQSRIDQDYLGWIPARIAVLPCMSWPTEAAYLGYRKEQVDPSRLRETCLDFDRFLLLSFRNQPFMQGYSPKFVKEALKKSRLSVRLEDITSMWQASSASCQSDCRKPHELYRQVIRLYPSWQKWLQRLSRSVNLADAVLLPMVAKLGERVYDDRGLWVGEHQAELVMLLIDVRQGNLIWEGHRSAFSAVDAKKREALPSLQWSMLRELLFTELLWKDFPGRQIY